MNTSVPVGMPFLMSASHEPQCSSMMSNPDNLVEALLGLRGDNADLCSHLPLQRSFNSSPTNVTTQCTIGLRELAVIISDDESEIPEVIYVDHTSKWARKRSRPAASEKPQKRHTFGSTASLQIVPVGRPMPPPPPLFVATFGQALIPLQPINTLRECSLRNHILKAS